MNLYPHSTRDAALILGGLVIAHVSAVIVAAVGFLVADQVIDRMYRRHPNLPHPAAFGAMEDTAEWFVPEEWREPFA